MSGPFCSQCDSTHTPDNCPYKAVSSAPQSGYCLIREHANCRWSDCACGCHPKFSHCTLCGESIYPREELYGIDFPQCGPVHFDCAELDNARYLEDMRRRAALAEKEGTT